MGDEVKSRFRMFQRQGGVYYWQDNETRQQWFAQATLGGSNRAVHEAHARDAIVVDPSLET